jgi:hypothetical protein
MIPLRTLGADAGDLTQTPGLLLDDLEHGFTKGAHELLRVDGPNAANHAGTEIFLDPLDCCWCRGLKERGPELEAVRPIVDPAAARLDELAGGNHRRMADEGDQITVASRFHPQHAEAVLGVVKGDAIDQIG